MPRVVVFISMITFNIYLYDTEEPNQKPKKIDILKLAKNAGDEDYLNEPTRKLLMFNNQSYLQMPLRIGGWFYCQQKVP